MSSKIKISSMYSLRSSDLLVNNHTFLISNSYHLHFIKNSIQALIQIPKQFFAIQIFEC